MTIKHIYILLVTSILLVAGLSSCSDDDDNKALIAGNKIEVDSESVVITIDENNKAIVNILNGGGEYSILALNPEIATANIAGNSIEIEGIKGGKTDIILMDNNGFVKNISVYNNYPNIAFDSEIIKFDHFYGKQSSIKIIPLPGNGDYKVSLDEESQKTIEAKGSKDGITLTNLVNTGTAKLKITDLEGIEAEIVVELTTTIKPYTDLELEEIKNSKSVVYEWRQNPLTYFNSRINTKEGELNVIGADYYGMSYLKVYFPGDQTIGEKQGCKLEYNSWGNEEKVDLSYFEIVKFEDNWIWIVFSYVDIENNISKAGKIITSLE